MSVPTLSRLRAGVFLTLALALGATWLHASAPAAPPAPEPSSAPLATPATVPATGQQHIDVQIPRFGRYAFLAVGGSGSAITLVDRIAGPIASDGEPGVRQGRIDAVLEPGAYRVRLQSPKDGLGAVRVEVRPYVEQHDPAPELLDGALAEGTLRDLEERSWWVRTDGTLPVVVDAAGRSLTDLRLWRDGSWSVNAPPRCDTLADVDGNQLGRCTLSARLEAGLYRVVASGGPARPRGDGGGAEPMWIRRGVGTLAEGSRVTRTISPFGIERFLVSSAGIARLELLSPGAASLDIRGWSAAGPGGSTLAHAGVLPESRELVAAVSLRGSPQLVEVRGAPGQAYRLQRYTSAGTARITGNGPVWVSSYPAANPDDELDQTGIAILRGGVGAPSTVVAASAVPLSEDRPYRRRFNLRGPSSLYVDVQSAGRWRFEAAGLKIRVSPLSEGSDGPGFKVMEPAPDRVAIELPVGLQRVDLIPAEPGVIELVMAPEGAPTPQTLSRPLVAARFPALTPERGKDLTVHLAPISGVGTGIVTRPLPALLSEPLPVVVGAGEHVEISVRAEQATVIQTDVEGLLLSLDEGDATPQVTVGSSARRLRVHNRGGTAIVTSIGPLPPAPRPSAPADLRPGEDRLPRLTVREAVSGDLTSNAATQWRVVIPERGLWRVESTGLLALSGTLSDRAGQRRALASANGTGRNVQLDAELLPGELVLDLNARSSSAGHYGLRMRRLPELEGGALRPGLPARAELPAGSGLSFLVEVAEKGSYALNIEAPGLQPTLRLADQDGWPLFPAGEPLDDLRLDPGTYALTVLPLQGDAQVRAELRRLDRPALPEGHGPFALSLGQSAEHIWWEPADPKAARDADVWSFDLAARAPISLSWSSGMEGRLVPATGSPLEGLRSGWEGTLEAGSWRLELRASTVDNGLPYKLRLTPGALVAGAELSTSAPGERPVLVGERGLYTLSSVASGDLRARLSDAQGRVVWSADDQPGTWDFSHTAALEPGAYTLWLSPVDASRWTSARVSMTRQRPTDGGAARPGTWTLTPDGDGERREITLAEGELLVFQASSAENLEVALDGASGQGWKTLTTDAGRAPWVAALGPARLQLRLWSLDRRGIPATARLAVGRPQSGLSLGEAAPKVQLARGEGGLLSLQGPAGTRICAVSGQACAAPEGERVAAGGPLWAVALDLFGAGKPALQAARLGPQEQEIAAFPGARLSAPGTPAILRLSAATRPPQLGCVRPCFAEARPRGVGGDATLLLSAGEAATLLDDGSTAPLTLRAALQPLAQARTLSVKLPWSGQIARGEVLRLELGAARPLALTLSPGLVLRAERGERSTTFDAGPEGLALTLDAGASTLVIANPTGAVAALSARETGALGAGALVRVVNPGAGLLALEMGAGTLHASGAEELVATGPGGVLSGEGALTLPEGTWSVRVRHGAGPLALWREAPGELAAALLSEGAEPVKLNTREGRVPLRGEATALRLPAGEAGPLSLFAPGAAALITTGADGRSTLLFPDSTGMFDVLVKQESQTLVLRSLGGPPLWGEAVLQPVQQATLPAEGAGEPTLLAPGERRAYAVDLKEPTRLALGVRASPEGARALVLGPDGARLGAGLVEELTLPAGRSWLVIHADAQGGPVTARPVVAGRTPPRAPAPPEVVQEYARASGRLLERPPADDEEIGPLFDRGWDANEGDTGAPEIEDEGEMDTGGAF